MGTMKDGENRYSSIDMCRETGMTSEGLRFYEKKGLLQVDKDERNGYRTYPIMKVPMLRSTRILNSYGIPLDKIAGLVQTHENHAHRLIEELDSAGARMEYELEWKRRCLCRLEEHREALSHPAGEIWFAEMEEMAYLQYDDAAHLKADKTLRVLVDRWLQCLPIVEPAPCLPKKDVGTDCYCPAGFAVRRGDLEFLGLEMDEHVRLMPRSLYICMVITQQEENGILAREALSPLISFAGHTGLEINGDALFRCLSFESYDSGSVKLHYKVMLPVRVRETSK
ncbi:MAG: MerR family transcriptional regulator [Clostridia bacterium]|nr:MerR family transcriptional regulator [Clostridia bacterium]